MSLATVINSERSITTDFYQAGLIPSDIHLANFTVTTFNGLAKP